MKLPTSLALLSFLKLALAATVEPRANRDVTIKVVNARLAPDGFPRSTIVANGAFPGPLISATKGDTLRVTVNNRLTDASMRRSTAFNFDNIFFKTGSAYIEAEPFINACLIAPGGSFTCAVPLGTQTGTHWYHSELSIQYIDGLRGPLIIYDPLDPHRRLYYVDDRSTIIQLSDWWHSSTLPMLDNYRATGIIPVSDSGLVNGAGHYNTGPAVPWSAVNVIRGKRYRFRIINESARNVFTVSVDNHDVRIIKADGELTQPNTVQKLDLLAANYWFNAPFVGGSPTRNPNQNATLSRAVLRYLGAPIADPIGAMRLGPDDGALAEADLRPLVPQSVPDPDIKISLDLEVVPGQAFWNVSSFLPEKVPALERALEGASQPSDFNRNCLVLPPNKIVEISAPHTDDDDAHPLHLHGNNFYVIKSMSSPNTNTVNPIRCDVVAVGGSGTTIRFKTDNAGPWMFHCHIYWHKQAGLATVMLVDPTTTKTVVHPSRAWAQPLPCL